MQSQIIFNLREQPETEVGKIPEGTRSSFFIARTAQELTILKYAHNNGLIALDEPDEAIQGVQISDCKYPRHLPMSPLTASTGQPAVSPVAHLEQTPANSDDRQIDPAAQNVCPIRPHQMGNRQAFIQTHQANLRQRLQHRIEVAMAQGDRELLRQLEQEMQLLG